jgi:HEAT repeat protein
VALLRVALDEDSWESFSRGSALRRAGREGFARNVAVALGNWGDPSAVPALSQGLNDPHPLVRAHAAWALGQVGSAQALSLLRERLPAETGPVLVRGHSAWALGEIGSAEAVAKIEAFDPVERNPLVRDAGGAALQVPDRNEVTR